MVAERFCPSWAALNLPTSVASANSTLQTTLEYSCTCSNGSAPGLEYYLQTLPTFICEQAFKDCIDANVGNARGQTNCTDNIQSQCGTINAQADEASTTTTSAAAATNAPTGTGSANTGATATPSSSSSTGFAAPTANPARYGNAAAVAAIGLFAYMI